MRKALALLVVGMLAAPGVPAAAPTDTAVVYFTVQ